MQIEATLPDGTQQSFEQMVAGRFRELSQRDFGGFHRIDRPGCDRTGRRTSGKNRRAGHANKFWQGIFNLPVYVPAGEQPCIYDWFGTRRSFNGSAYDYFHSGMDYGVCFAENSFDIYAAAPGTVVFAGPLTVRGNATFIDHGWGVYSAYFHQKEIYVSVGQQVQAGELIGQIGATGRVTGPHLHFEVWAGGVQVNPLDWLNQAISVERSVALHPCLCYTRKTGGPLSTASIVNFLKQSDIFYQFTPTQLELVANLCQEATYQKDDLIFRENSGSKELYIIVQGEVDIFVDPSLVGSTDVGSENKIIATLRRGQNFGEVALVDEGLRSASACAAQKDTRLLDHSARQVDHAVRHVSPTWLSFDV